MRNRVSILLLLIAVFSFAGANTLGERQQRGGTTTSLKQQLEFGLKARRPTEFRFIANVVQMVDQGKLSMKLVKSTFQWARHRRPYQFPYFERGLRLRAARLGIVVPKSDSLK